MAAPGVRGHLEAVAAQRLRVVGADGRLILDDGVAAWHGPAANIADAGAPYAAVVAPNDGLHAGQGLDYVRSGLVDHITPEIAGIVHEMLLSRDSAFMLFRAAGGAVNAVPAHATAASEQDSAGVMKLSEVAMMDLSRCAARLISSAAP